MSIFHFPKYFRLFLIFLFFLFFIKNKNKGEHILFIVFINVSISFFPDFSDFHKSRFFFRVNDSPKNVNDSPKNVNDSPKHVNDSPKHVNDSPKKPMPTIHGFSFFLLFFGLFGLFLPFSPFFHLFSPFFTPFLSRFSPFFEGLHFSPFLGTRKIVEIGTQINTLYTFAHFKRRLCRRK